MSPVEQHYQILDEPLTRLRATRSSYKWRAFAPDVVPVWLAEMDARPCEPVTAEIIEALRRGDTGYRWPQPYLEAFAGFAERRWQWPVDIARSMVVPDVMIGISEVLRTATCADAPVVLSSPTYDSFYLVVASLAKQVVDAPLNQAHRLDEGALDRAFRIAGRGAAYVLCNPQNPTGTVHTQEELEMLARLADRHGVLVIANEIHAPLTLPGITAVPYQTILGSETAVTLTAASKAWNINALKGGLLVAGARAGNVLRGLHEVVTHGAPQLGLIAQTAAYRDGVPWLDQLRNELGERRTLLIELCAQRMPAIKIAPAEATYLAWLDCRALGLDDPAETFLERGRVALGRGEKYAPGARKWLRFSFATSPDVIATAVTGMASCLPRSA